MRELERRRSEARSRTLAAALPRPCCLQDYAQACKLEARADFSVLPLCPCSVLLRQVEWAIEGDFDSYCKRMRCGSASTLPARPSVSVERGVAVIARNVLA